MDRWLYGILGGQMEDCSSSVCPLRIYSELKPGVKSTQVRSVKEPDIYIASLHFIIIQQGMHTAKSIHALSGQNTRSDSPQV